ncbi:BCCT family transporter [Winkia neuii]|uniref:BCCT family transporter n=1 Tax=Winkia TaxID=2692118 RepID=UPI001431B736|nr:BCCT family transporter [Winkia sp. UMB1295B]MDK7185428.1 BCCT family transporter [Winkia sp. UMB1295B]NJJ16390.1 BCCT family transporter [Winkia neuii]
MNSEKKTGSRPQIVTEALRIARKPIISIHPGLIPGIDVADTGRKFPTNKTVFAVALAFIVGIVGWAGVAPENLKTVGTTVQSWLIGNFGWLLSTLMVVCIIFMLVIGFGPTGKIRLGADDSEPEYSTTSWISMLFAAGLGIGLVFYGPMEPLQHFLTPPPGTPDGQGSEAVYTAIAQALLHQASLAWGVYAMVGGAIAYSAYRRGRLPLISALFEPVFPDGSNRVLGKIIDILAVLVTILGTATSLGIGALQIRTGTSFLTGKSLEGNTFVVVIMVLLTILFTFSAVSGIKRGIRFLSNSNMVLVVVLALFVLISGPTVFLLDAIPASLYSFVDSFCRMLALNASQGQDAKEFVTTWTMMYWAWWISWSPFVGTFIAKISKSRTLREFVSVVIFVPAGISAIWYVLLGGTAIRMNMNGTGLQIKGSGENVMFDLLERLPLSTITEIVVLLAVVIFFVTAADSATNVVASMSQTGRPNPATVVTVVWGVALGAVAIALLLAGGQDALSGLQAMMVTFSLPFAVVLLGVMIAWAKDLRNDPYMIRRAYARHAIAKGVHSGIEEYGDDFVFGTSEVPSGEGAGTSTDYDSADPSLSEWYTEVDSKGAVSSGGTDTPEGQNQNEGENR